MLTIRMQRTGRKGHAQFRVVVQDSKFSPSSGRVVARIGHHDPHTKETVIDKDAASKYLTNGAQPSPRVVRLFTAEKIAMPDWVEKPADDKKREIKNPEKLRKNRPAEPVEEAPAEEPAAESADAPADDVAAEEAPSEAPAEEKAEAEQKPAEEPAAEAEKADDTPAEESEKTE